jgi:ABC-type phosphate transport system auxiliary subunit
LEKERLANELSLVQSQLTDSHSNLQMLQKVHDELAATKSELENNKRVMADIEKESKNKTISELETEILRLTILFANVRSSQTTEL